MKARILNIQRMSTEDGPGIRSTVFFKGCPLACSWCHNPESIASGPRTVFSAERCIGCGNCSAVCEQQALPPPGQGPRPDPARCQACGRCVEQCPAAALELLGQERELDGLFDELIRDRVFFEESGGGVTASGGEPLLWPKFVAELFARLRAEGIGCALDTCGQAQTEALRAVAAAADLILYDLKAIDSELHRRHTGLDNHRILENLRDLAAGRRPGQRLWIRTPLIPGATASAENLAGLGRFLAGELNGAVERWELLAFNNLCREQYARLGLRWAFSDTPLFSRIELDELAAAARGSGLEPERVVVSGPTRLE